MLFSVIIEIIQYVTCRGLCETDDVLCNGFGSLIGYWLYISLRKVWARTQRLTNNDFSAVLDAKELLPKFAVFDESGDEFVFGEGLFK